MCSKLRTALLAYLKFDIANILKQLNEKGACREIKRNLIMMLLCLMFVYFLSSQAFAIMVGLSTEELTRASEVVIRGEVEDVESLWSKDRKIIFTSASIVINDVIKGKIAQEKIVVEYEGGEIGNIGLRVSDVSPLKKGERVVLFIKAGKSKKDELGDIYNIAGSAQGKYIIGDDGIARKSGFSVVDGKDVIDNNISVDALIGKIRG